MIDILYRFKGLFVRHVDISMAWKAAFFLGVIVWFINLQHGALAALPAALKQAAYSFFVAGFIIRLCENLAVSLRGPVVAIVLAAVIPAGIAIGLTFLVHSLRGTPEPFYSTLPTIVSTPPTFLWWGIRCRSKINGIAPPLESEG